MAEINALSAKIKAHEKKEALAADKMLDAEWEKVEKKPKNWYNHTMYKTKSLTSDQKKHMRDLQKLRVLQEFNSLMEQKIAALKHNKKSHA